MRVFLALLKKCVLRRTRNLNGVSIPYGFLAEVLVPLGFFYLFSYIGSEMDTEVIDAAVPSDTYSLDFMYPMEGQSQSIVFTPTWVDFVERGYTNDTKPICYIPEEDAESAKKKRAGGGGDSSGIKWGVRNELNFLLDCTPSSYNLRSWMEPIQVEDQCKSEGQDVTDSCQKLVIGLTVKDGMTVDDGVTKFLESHKDYLMK